MSERQVFCHVCGHATSNELPVRQEPRPVSPVDPPLHPLAIVSLVLGLLAYGPLPFIGAVAAIITGHMTRRRLRVSREPMRGKGMATAGMVLGYVQLALIPILIAIALALLIPAAVKGMHD